MGRDRETMMTLRNSGRRAFLRTAGGLVLGLPLLEYTHEKAWAAPAGTAKRLVVVFNHGGETMCVQKSGLRAGNPNTRSSRTRAPIQPPSPPSATPITASRSA